MAEEHSLRGKEDFLQDYYSTWLYLNILYLLNEYSLHG